MPPGRLALARARSDANLPDRCSLEAYASSASDSFGDETDTYADAVTHPCAFDPSASSEVMLPDNSRLIEDAQLRLSKSVTIGYRDRVTITHRYGTEVEEPTTYEVIGVPEYGAAALIVHLRAVSL